MKFPLLLLSVLGVACAYTMVDLENDLRAIEAVAEPIRRAEKPKPDWLRPGMSKPGIGRPFIPGKGKPSRIPVIPGKGKFVIPGKEKFFNGTRRPGMGKGGLLKKLMDPTRSLRGFMKLISTSEYYAKKPVTMEMIHNLVYSIDMVEHFHNASQDARIFVEAWEANNTKTNEEKKATLDLYMKDIDGLGIFSVAAMDDIGAITYRLSTFGIVNGTGIDNSTTCTPKNWRCISRKMRELFKDLKTMFEVEEIPEVDDTLDLPKNETNEILPEDEPTEEDVPLEEIEEEEDLPLFVPCRRLVTIMKDAAKVKPFHLDEGDITRAIYKDTKCIMNALIMLQGFIIDLNETTSEVPKEELSPEDLREDLLEILHGSAHITRDAIHMMRPLKFIKFLLLKEMGKLPEKPTRPGQKPTKPGQKPTKPGQKPTRPTGRKPAQRYIPI